VSQTCEISVAWTFETSWQKNSVAALSHMLIYHTFCVKIQIYFYSVVEILEQDMRQDDKRQDDKRQKHVKQKIECRKVQRQKGQMAEITKGSNDNRQKEHDKENHKARMSKVR